MKHPNGVSDFGVGRNLNRFCNTRMVQKREIYEFDDCLGKVHYVSQSANSSSSDLGCLSHTCIRCITQRSFSKCCFIARMSYFADLFKKSELSSVFSTSLFHPVVSWPSSGPEGFAGKNWPFCQSRNVHHLCPVQLPLGGSSIFWVSLSAQVNCSA